MSVRIINSDCRTALLGLADQSVNCIVTSPPYFGLRDYGVDGQMGLEGTPDAFVAELVGVLRETRRVLRDDGTLWLNLGDSYANDARWGGRTSGKHASAVHGNPGIGRRRTNTGLKFKDMVGIPWRVAFALQAEGWYLRQDIIWHKPNPMPESVTDRCTKAHEYIFLLSKSEQYYFDNEAIKEPTSQNLVTVGRNKRADKGIVGPSGLHGTTFGQSGNGGFARGEGETRNKRSVWTVTTKPFKGAHFATFPPDLIEPCILAGCPIGGTVLDPFFGAGTTGLVAQAHGRNCVGVELNPEYVTLANTRLGLDCSEGIFG